MNWIEKHLGKFSATIGIVGLILSTTFYILDKPGAAILCVTLFAVFFLSAFLLLLRVSRQYLQVNHNDKTTLQSAYITLRSNDGVIFHYDSYRTVLCKQLFITTYEQKFRWYSKTLPADLSISSSMQDVVEIKSTNDNNDYHVAVLELRQPLRLNQCAVIHFHAVDTNPLPQLDAGISGDDIKLIHYTVQLTYKPDSFNKPAILECRRKDSSLPADFHELKTIPFDPQTKSYVCPIENPKINYFYRLRWEM